MIKSVRAKKPVHSLVEDHYPKLRAVYETRSILNAVPVAVEVADYCGNKILSFVFEFGTFRCLMPVHEIGTPIWPLYRSANSFGPGDLWSFLALSNRRQDQVKHYMVNLIRANMPLPFRIISLDGDGGILSRVVALRDLARKVKLSKGQRIEVSVLAAPASGAWCSHKGRLVFIPREEVYYGDVAPREMLKPGRTYLAEVLDVGDIVRVSTRKVEDDPWDALSLTERSVRRATVRGRLSDGDYYVSFCPGVTAKVSVPPLMSVQAGDSVMVKILRVNRRSRFILGHVIG
jgi:hypothetical protein